MEKSEENLRKLAANGWRMRYTNKGESVEEAKGSLKNTGGDSIGEKTEKNYKLQGNVIPPGRLIKRRRREKQN